jgi:thioredoxin-like negative regulator of GroEL
MVPILQEVHEKMSDKINIVKIDTEKYTSIANRYSIQALPTFIIFKNGEPCYRFVSLMNHVFSMYMSSCSISANKVINTT